jgi:hypothetical protein
MFDQLATLLVLGADSSSSIPDWIPVAALVAGAISLIGLVINRVWDRRDRRRGLYSNAYQAALAWGEMYYRVRRRDPGKAHELAQQFHTIQEKIDFHQGWIASESEYLGRAYCRLVLRTKALTVEHIRRAWTEPPVSPDEGFSVVPVVAAELEQAKERFILDLRRHLSFNPFRRGALAWAYSDERWERIKAKTSSTD